MSRLYLFRHSMVTVDKCISSDQWILSKEGVHAAQSLSKQIRPLRIEMVFTSPEQKCVQTSEALFGHRGIPIETDPDLVELKRGDYIENYREAVGRAMATPDIGVFDWEAVDKAKARFAACVDRIITANPDKEVAIISHGIVISTYVSEIVGETGAGIYDRWVKERFPDLAIIDMVERKVVHDFGEF